MRAAGVIAAAALATLTACVPPVSQPDIVVPPGKPLTVAVGRGGDRAKVVVRHEDGSPVTEADAARVIAKGKTVACERGWDALDDKISYEDGAATVDFYCVKILQSDEVIAAPSAFGGA